MRLINGQANKQIKLVHPSPAATTSAGFSPTLWKQWKITVHLEKSDVTEIMKEKKESYFPNPNSPAPSSKEGQAGSGRDLFFT